MGLAAPFRRRNTLTTALLAGFTVCALTAGATEVSPELKVTGMTFVGTRGEAGELILRAREAIFRPDTRMAEMEDVRVTASDEAKGQNFEVTCDRGELNVDTNDFLAEGNVEGATGDGRWYSADWVRYEHETGLLYTDSPVVMVDDTGTFRGDGFRYQIKERTFKLIGNVSVVQE